MLTYSIYNAVLFRGAWQITFRFQGTPFPSNDQPRDRFGNQTVIEGSPEEQAIVTAAKQRDDEKARLYKESGEPYEQIFIYNYKEYDPVKCNNIDCSDANIILWNKWITVDFCCRRKHRINTWFDSITQFYFTPDQTGRNYGHLFFKQGSPNVIIYFNKKSDFDAFHNQFRPAFASCLEAYCPHTEAPACSNFNAQKLGYN